MNPTEGKLTPEQIEIIDKADEFLRHKSDCAIHQDLGFEERICGCGYVEAMVNLRSLKFLPLESLKAPAVTTGEWLPISTAPRDGSKFLGIQLGWKTPMICKWWEKEQRFGITRSKNTLSHWMPLPQPPNSTTLSAPAPLSSEAVGKVIQKVKELCDMTPHRPYAITWENGNEMITFVQDELAPTYEALLTPSPSEKEKP